MTSILAVCPKCNQFSNIVPIIYGEPSEEGIKNEKEGRIFFGGCIMEKDSPRKYCKKCKLKF